MYKLSTIIEIIFICMVVVIVNNISNAKLPYLNSITSYDNNRYYILYSYASEKVKINGNYVEPNFDSKYYCYLKDDLKNVELVDHIKTYKELDGKLYLIGTDPIEYSSSGMTYNYFVLNYDNDKLYKYYNLEEMPQSVRTVFEENIN